MSVESWHEDDNWTYLVFKTEDQTIYAHPNNTTLYLFPESPDADHIWVEADPDPDVDLGYRIWRADVETKVDEMFESFDE